MIETPSRARGPRPLAHTPLARGLASAVACALATLLSSAVLAQSTPSPLPSGPGRVEGRVVHPGGPARAAGVPVVLYGLSSTGQAGVASTTADERGAFRFEGVSNDADMAYLVGARYRSIPFFGARVSFAPGSTETTAVVDISDPSADASGIGVSEVIIQFEWAGDRLAVQEVHRLRSASDAVVLVNAAERATISAPFETQLPEQAADFVSSSMGFEDEVENDDGRVRYWGPIYPGNQDIRFQYTLPLSTTSPETAVTLTFPMGADGVSVLTATGGPRIADAGPLAPPEEIDLEGRKVVVQRVANVASGSSVAFSLALPTTSTDASRIEIARSDAWIEYDDTQLAMNQQTMLRVAGTERIAGAGDAPVLSIPLPAGADRLEISAEALALGAKQVENTVALFGPIPPGEVGFGIRYRLGTTPEGTELALHYPLEVKALNILVADTGISVTSDRLHRRRPFRQGTRIYLHREAFNVAANESVTVRLQPIREARLGNRAAAAMALVTVLAAAGFLAQPLVRARAIRSLPAQTPISIQRDALYQDIRDLDHDFETGKLTKADHGEMREAVRARAVELLRRERSTSAAAEAVADGEPGCPGCGERIQSGWAFCSHCGARISSES